MVLTPQLIGDISFKDIHFRYGTRSMVFEGLNLHIEKSKVTALVGESGSGKSTLISLLQNLYAAQSGTITIGDYNLKYLENQSLRKLVSVVPQRIDLFAGNIVDNIAVGDEAPSMEKIVEACRKSLDEGENSKRCADRNNFFH